MGSCADYTAKVVMEIDVTGNDDIVADKTYVFTLDPNNKEESLINEIIGLGDDFIAAGDEEGEYFDRELCHKSKNFKECVRKYFTEDFDISGDTEVIITTKSIININKDIINKIDKLNCEYQINNNILIVTLASVSNDIYYETDNSDRTDIDINTLMNILNNIPRNKIKMYLYGNGETF